MSNKEFIDLLGGSAKVAEALGIAPNVVANWFTRPIPWKRRHALARLAGDKAVTLPRDFWAEQAA